MKKILCPVDFSDVSRNALLYALQLADTWDTQVDLIHIYHLEAREAASVPYHEVDELLEAKKAEVDRYFRDFTAGLKTDRIGRLLKAYGIFIGLEISDLTRDGAYSLVVMGTHGERNSLEKFLGSVSTDLMTRSHCPVMAIPAGAVYQSVEAIAYAVAEEAMDWSKGMDTGLEDLLGFTKSSGAKLHVVHVVKETGTERDVELRVEDYPISDATYAVVSDASVLEGLDNYIEENEIQVLAMYIPKRRLWERLFHRSNTKAMTFHTSIPLLVFHA